MFLPDSSSNLPQLRILWSGSICSFGPRDGILNCRVLRNLVIQFRSKHDNFVRVEEDELCADLRAPSLGVTVPVRVPIVRGLIAAAEAARVNEDQKRLGTDWKGFSQSQTCRGCSQLERRNVHSQNPELQPIGSLTGSSSQEPRARSPVMLQRTTSSIEATFIHVPSSR